MSFLFRFHPLNRRPIRFRYTELHTKQPPMDIPATPGPGTTHRSLTVESDRFHCLFQDNTSYDVYSIHHIFIYHILQYVLQSMFIHPITLYWLANPWLRFRLTEPMPYFDNFSLESRDQSSKVFSTRSPPKKSQKGSTS